MNMSSEAPQNVGMSHGSVYPPFNSNSFNVSHANYAPPINFMQPSHNFNVNTAPNQGQFKTAPSSSLPYNQPYNPPPGYNRAIAQPNGNTLNDSMPSFQPPLPNPSFPKPNYNGSAPKMGQIMPNASAPFSANVNTCTTKSALLKTAVIPALSSFNEIHSLNLLMDDGGTRSFITTKVAKELNLPTVGEEQLDMTLFGNVCSGYQNFNIAEISILCADNSVITIYPVIVPVIATNMILQSNLIIDQYPQFKQLMFAPHVNDNLPFDIDILIGGDFYYQFYINACLLYTSPSPRD